MIDNAESLISQGYYSVDHAFARSRPFSASLIECPTFPIIAEVKLSSPTGASSAYSASYLADLYVQGGAACISVLTEPSFFKGSLEHLRSIASMGFPTLMKDVIISRQQIKAAAYLGASSILLIESILNRNELREKNDNLLEYAHKLGLEVLLEVTNEKELENAFESAADLVGINQRDLSSLTVDKNKGSRLLSLCKGEERPVIVMSGLGERDEVKRLKEEGADAVLIGTRLSQDEFPANALRSLMVPK